MINTINRIKVGTTVHSIVPILCTMDFEKKTANPLRVAFGTSINGTLAYGLTIAVGSGIVSGPSGLGLDVRLPFAIGPYGLNLKLNSEFGVNTDGLTLVVGSGLKVDANGLNINLKDPNGPLVVGDKGLKFVIGSDVYSDETESANQSLAGYRRLRLRLSKHTATPNGEKVYIGNAIASTEYGLSLRIGSNLIVENDTLYVKLSHVTETSASTASENRIPGNAIMTIYDSTGDGVGNPGLSLRLHEREIDGESKSLLTITDNGLDIDTEALKTVLGLS